MPLLFSCNSLSLSATYQIHFSFSLYLNTMQSTVSNPSNSNNNTLTPTSGHAQPRSLRKMVKNARWAMEKRDEKGKRPKQPPPEPLPGEPAEYSALRDDTLRCHTHHGTFGSSLLFQTSQSSSSAAAAAAIRNMPRRSSTGSGVPLSYFGASSIPAPPVALASPLMKQQPQSQTSGSKKVHRGSSSSSSSSSSKNGYAHTAASFPHRRGSTGGFDHHHMMPPTAANDMIPLSVTRSPTASRMPVQTTANGITLSLGNRFQNSPAPSSPTHKRSQGERGGSSHAHSHHRGATGDAILMAPPPMRGMDRPRRGMDVPSSRGRPRAQDAVVMPPPTAGTVTLSSSSHHNNNATISSTSMHATRTTTSISAHLGRHSYHVTTTTTATANGSVSSSGSSSLPSPLRQEGMNDSFNSSVSSMTMADFNNSGSQTWRPLKPDMAVAPLSLDDEEEEEEEFHTEKYSDDPFDRDMSSISDLSSSQLGMSSSQVNTSSLMMAST